MIFLLAITLYIVFSEHPNFSAATLAREKISPVSTQTTGFIFSWDIFSRRAIPSGVAMRAFAAALVLARTSGSAQAARVAMDVASL